MVNDIMAAETGKLIEGAYRKVFEENVSNDSNKITDNGKEIISDGNKNKVAESCEGTKDFVETLGDNNLKEKLDHGKDNNKEDEGMNLMAPETSVATLLKRPRYVDQN